MKVRNKLVFYFKMYLINKKKKISHQKIVKLNY